MTKYEELEETHAELKLKQLLWDSLEEWDQMAGGWTDVSNNISVVCVWLTHREKEQSQADILNLGTCIEVQLEDFNPNSLCVFL